MKTKLEKIHWGIAAPAGLFLLAILAFAGCDTVKSVKREKTFARFYLEVNPKNPAEDAETVVMPASGASISIYPKPILTERDYENVELAKVDAGHCLLFSIKSDRAPILYNATARNRGLRLVLKVNDQPVGVRVISEMVYNGMWMTFAEIPDKELVKLAVNLKRTAQQFSKFNQ